MPPCCHAALTGRAALPAEVGGVDPGTEQTVDHAVDRMGSQAAGWRRTTRRSVAQSSAMSLQALRRRL